MPDVLLINPNTSTSVSALLHSHAQRIAGTRAQVHTVTARFGAPYIACEPSYAVAAHAALDIWAASVVNSGVVPHAVLLGCFGDPGLLALRSCSDVPVTGLAEAAFIEAARFGRFAIVTGGHRWKPMLERLVRSLGFDAQLAGIQTVEQSGADLARNPAAALLTLTTACLQAARQFDAQAVILGGAGLAGMAQKLQPAVPVPVIDSVEAGVRHALQILGRATAPTRTFDFAWHNMAPELTALGAKP
jgi:allantoin racemase